MAVAEYNLRALPDAKRLEVILQAILDQLEIMNEVLNAH